VETVHQQTLDQFGKGTTIDQSRTAIDLLNEQGIITECSFILGNLDETIENIDRTLATALEFNPDLAHFLLLTPWPYTLLYKEVEKSIVEWDYAKYHFVHPVIKPLQMEISQLWSALINCFKVFYLNKTRQVFSMPEGFKRTYMMKSIQIMHHKFFVDNFGQAAISLPREKGDLIGQMIGEFLHTSRTGSCVFDHIETFREDSFFQCSLGLKQVPSSPTLRQRFDKVGNHWNGIVMEESARMLKHANAAITPCHGNLAPLDIDVSPFDNSGTEKEGVSRTYKGHDGYAPIFSYLGEEGYCINTELREGKDHSQNNTAEYLSKTIK